MNDSSKRVLLVVIVVAVIIALGVVFRKGFSNSSTQKSDSAASQPAGETAKAPAPLVPAPAADRLAETKPSEQKPAPKLSYAEALQKYADTRIQLTEACQAVPNQVVYKNGVSVMLDNRASSARKVLFNARAYTIPAYDFVVLPLVSQSVPSVTYLDCAEKQNVATIRIEK